MGSPPEHHGTYVERLNTALEKYPHRYDETLE